MQRSPLQLGSSGDSVGAGLRRRCSLRREPKAPEFTNRASLGSDPSLLVAVHGPRITNDIELPRRAAIDGVGLANMSEEQATPHPGSGWEQLGNTYAQTLGKTGE